MKSDNKLINLLYRGGLFWFNVYLFFKLSSSAMNFARTYTNAYTPVVSHLLIILFGIGFFIIFKNMALLAVNIEEKDQDSLEKSFKQIGISGVFILFVMLLVQILPEFLLSMSYQY